MHPLSVRLGFVLDPPLDDELRERIIAVWADATNAGGAVGFVAPVTAADVRPTAEAAFAGVAAGVDRLLVGHDDAGLAAFVFVTSNRFDLKEHWRVLKRVVVTPGRQGRGYGLALMAEAERVGRSMGLSALQVTIRDGHGLPAFYQRCGYREVGRLPGALRVADGDDRDEIIMWRELSGAPTSWPAAG
ncbi:GNAT family N-acetyltransferase [Micromonospora sp. Llam0]|uniref:GNAT family N-acetyltransferase n=1 Tax=Micromonospora sp. Llam0 TaxID=2485143 RepID=UPI000F4953FC|nr:GNAT family N-acetyltransferase [Micromonospora sp. Llam0]